MTREEAIQILKESHITYVAPNGNELKAEAIDMAISALQEESRPIKVRDDGTLFVKVLDVSRVERVIIGDDSMAIREDFPKPFSNFITESPNDVVEKNDEVIDHDREWIIGCIKHDGFIKTDRFDKANQIILEALEKGCESCKWYEEDHIICYPKGGDAEMRNDRTYTNAPYMQQTPSEDGSDLMSHEEAWKQIESDLISRADAINKIMMDEFNLLKPLHKSVAKEYIESVPSADRPTEDRLYIKIYVDDEPSRKAEKLYQICGGEDGENQEITNWLKEYFPSADTESDDLIIKNGKGIQDGLYNIKDGEIFKYKAKGGTVRAYKLVPSVSAPQGDLISRADVLSECVYRLPLDWCDKMEKVINNLPSVSSERVGKWIWEDNKEKCGYYCSVCGEEMEMDSKANYCPNCGAKMGVSE